jgi:ring-1,2-phenylacetyl-CoA epoxidase subunit PaaB
METFEVFRRSGHKDPYEHCGAVTAPDPDMALIMAKECFLRRGEGEHLWVVRRTDIHAFSGDPAIDIVADKSYRHPSGYRDVMEKRERALKRVHEIQGAGT